MKKFLFIAVLAIGAFATSCCEVKEKSVVVDETEIVTDTIETDSVGSEVEMVEKDSMEVDE